MLRPITLLPALFLSACAPAQLVWEKTLAPGLLYREEVDRAAPRVIHALRVTPGAPAGRMAPEPTGGAINETASAPTGRTTVGQTVATSGALAGVNADFFADLPKAWTGHPLGLMVRAGEMLATPNPKRSVFAWGPETLAFGKAEWQGAVRLEGGATLRLNGLNRAGGASEAILNGPAVGQAMAEQGDLTVVLRLDGALAPTCSVSAVVESVTDQKARLAVPAGKAALVVRGARGAAARGMRPGDRVTVEMRTTGFDWAKVEGAVGGGPMLVEDGETSIDEEGFAASAFVAARHPRTAVGRTAEGDVWLVAVDGRSAVSVGASLRELAAIMRRLGCVEAMNLDGGGSTTLAALGLTLNRPSDGRERPVANALLVRGAVPPPTLGALRLVVPATVRDGEEVDARVVDAQGRPVPNASILWAASGALWMDQGGRLRVLAAGAGVVQAAVDGQVLTAKVTVKG